jgi:hypothetical protein
MTKIRRFFGLNGLIDSLLRLLRLFVRCDRDCHVDSFKPEAILKNKPKSLCFGYFVAVIANLIVDKERIIVIGIKRDIKNFCWV